MLLYWLNTDRQTAGSADAPQLKQPLGRRSLGPEQGNGGLLIYEADLPAALAKYDPEGQVWTSIQPGKWVGYWRDCKPGPNYFARPAGDFLAGWEVELGDGNIWTLPRILKDTGETGLPRALRIDDAGNLVGTVIDKFSALSADGQRLFAQLMHVNRGGEAPDNPLSEEEIFRLVCRVVGINYRLGVAEVGALQLVTSANFLRLAFGVVGYDLLLQAEDSPPGET
jgi:catechol 2,3-dioxygenase-like lactoylglutathione lyase family enzyme